MVSGCELLKEGGLGGEEAVLFKRLINIILN